MKTIFNIVIIIYILIFLRVRNFANLKIISKEILKEKWRFKIVYIELDSIFKWVLLTSALRTFSKVVNFNN